MIRVRFSPEEIKSTKLIPAGKYGFILEDVKEGVTKEKKDKKFTWYFKGITGEAKDIPVSRIYTEEYQEFMWALIEKGFGAEGDENAGTDVDIESYKGRKIWLVVKVGEYGGSKRMEMEGFQPWEEGGFEESQALQE
jgi:hypothetical protein